MRMFSLEPRPPRVLHVCDDVVCRGTGSESLIAMLTERLGPAGTDLGGATWLRSPCLGQCDRAPAALLVESGPRPLERELTSVDVDSLFAVMGGATPAPPRAALAAADRPGGASVAGSDRRPPIPKALMTTGPTAVMPPFGGRLSWDPTG